MKQLSNWSAEYSSDFKFLLFINERGITMNNLPLGLTRNNDEQNRIIHITSYSM